MSTILITTSSFDLDTPEIRKLTGAGYAVKMNPYARRVTEEEVTSLLTPDVVGMIAGVEPLSRAVLKASNLKIISRCGAGLDNVDMDAANDFGIIVRNTPDAPAVAVAELTIGLILSALRHIPFQDKSIREGGWERPMGSLLGKKTLGIIGYGRIGRKVAEIAKAFGSNILFHDPFGIDGVTLDDLLEKSDIVTLHIPYSEKNKNLINKDRLNRMKSGSVLINTSRGGLVDENAVAESLRSGHLATAAFDVFEQEPYTGPLTNLQNVILTPHIGSYAKETRVMQEAESATNLYEELLNLKQKERAHG